MNSQHSADCSPVLRQTNSIMFAAFLRSYLLILGFPILLVSVVVVRCVRFPFLLKISNILNKVPSLILLPSDMLKKHGQDAVRIVDLMARGAAVLKITCLERSITLRFLLSQMGIPARIRLGVQRKDQQFLAHAWVEADVKHGESIVSLSSESEFFRDRAHLSEAFFAFPETPF